MEVYIFLHHLIKLFMKSKLKEIENIYIQLGVCIIIFIIGGILINNLIINLSRTGLGFTFNWIFKTSGFEIAEHLLPYTSSDNYAWAILNGWLNSLRVIFLSLFFSTILGILVGFISINKNPIFRLLSSSYITIIRQTPLLIQLMLWYFVGFLGLKNDVLVNIENILKISNKGIEIFNLNFSSEFSALLLGLSVFTSAYIAEIFRGGIKSVSQGQWEAFRSLGISERKGLLSVIIPQALPAVIPGLTSQFLNLAKNSTLAIAIGYSDIYAINDTIINQTGRAIECFIILMASFLLVNLIISNIMESINKLFIAPKRII